MNNAKADQHAAFNLLRSSRQGSPTLAAQGRNLALRILQSPAPIVVLCGPSRSGKTELVQRWVRPELEEHAHVITRSLDDEVDLGERSSRELAVEVWDELGEDLLRGQTQDLLARQLERFPADAASHRRAVLVVRDAYLGELFAMRSNVPRLLDEIIEIPRLSSEQLLAEIRCAASQLQLALDSNLELALKIDFDALAPDQPLGSNLIAVVAFELWRNACDGVAEFAPYAESGRLLGVLERFLDYVCEELPFDAELGWALLEAVARGSTSHEELTELAARFDTADDVPKQALDALMNRGVVIHVSERILTLEPPQLVDAVRRRAQRIPEPVAAARSLIRDGARIPGADDLALPEAAFLRVDRQRRHLRTTDEQSAFVLRSALLHDRADTSKPNAVAHWFRRIHDRRQRLEVLLSASADEHPHVRVRAVSMMCQLAAPELRAHLHLLALRDPDAAVRAGAAETLYATTAHDTKALTGFQDAFIRESRTSTSPHCLAAIAALRAFPSEDAVVCLRMIVDQHEPGAELEARRAAIATLGKHRSDASVTALLKIALEDRDREDRQDAIKALAEIDRAEVMERVYAELHRHRPSSQPPTPQPWHARTIIAAGAAAAFAVALLNLLIHGALLLTLRRLRLGSTTLAVEGLALAMLFTTPNELALIVLSATATVASFLPARFVWQRRERTTLEAPQNFRESYQRWLGWALFAGGALAACLIHGLACLIARRYGRALWCFGLQLCGLLLCYAALLGDQYLGMYASVSVAFTAVPFAFALGGVCLFVGSYALDIGTVLWDVLLRSEVRRTRGRTDAVGVYLLNNPLALPIVARWLDSSVASEARYCAGLLVRHPGGEPLRQIVQRMLHDATQRAHNRILHALARRDDAGSLGLLEELSVRGGLNARLWLHFTRFRMRILLFPRPLLAFVVIAFPALACCLLLLINVLANSPARLYEAASAERSGWFTRALSGSQQLAMQKLGTLARSDHSWLSSMALLELGKFLGEDQFDLERVRAALVQITRAAPGVRKMTYDVNGLEEHIVGMLRQPELRDEASAALRAINTPSVVRLLIESVDKLPKMQSESGPLAKATAAIHVLGQLDSEDLERMRALDAWQSKPNFHLQALAKATFEAAPLRARSAFLFDKAARAETELKTNEAPSDIYNALIDIAMRDEKADPVVAASILAKAHARLGRLAFTRSEAAAAEKAVWSGLHALHGIEVDPTYVSELFALGLDISNYWHDQAAQPSFKRSYALLESIVPLAIHFDSEWEMIAQANLAEATLTGGQYDLAEQRATAVLKRKVPSGSACVLVAMHYVRVVAATLRNDRAAAHFESELGKALGEPASADATDCSWSYRGLRRYIDQRVPRSKQSRLTNLLDTIEAVSERAR